MLRLLIALLITYPAFAKDVVLGDIARSEVRKLIKFNSLPSRYDSDSKTGEVYGEMYAELEVSTDSCFPGMDFCTPSTMTYSHRVFREKIDGLRLENSKLLYSGAKGDIVCGQYKKGRIIRSAIRLVLTKNCDLDVKAYQVEGKTRHQLVFSLQE